MTKIVLIAAAATVYTVAVTWLGSKLGKYLSVLSKTQCVSKGASMSLETKNCQHCGGVFIPNTSTNKNCRDMDCIRERGRRAHNKSQDNNRDRVRDINGRFVSDDQSV